MIKINSDYIKNNVSCTHCESTKLKRSYKKSFKSPIDELGNKQNTPMEWRQFTCSSCGEITNVLNTEEHIISTTEFAVLPFCAFNVELSIQESSLYAFFSYKETQGEVIEDDLRDEHILNMQHYFNKFNIYVENLMENLFQIYFHKDKHSFLSNSAVLNYLKKILSDAGCNVSIGEQSSFILDIYLSDEEYNSFLEEYQKYNITINNYSNFQENSTSLNCQCINCKSSNIILKDQKTFKDTVDESGSFYKGIIKFKEFFCTDCNTQFHLLLKDNQIINSSYDLVIPLAGFRFNIVFNEDFGDAGMMLFLKDQYNQNIEHDIRTEHVLGIEKFFHDLGVSLYNDMENVWLIEVNQDNEDLELNKNLIKFLINKMKEVGATLDKALEPDF